MAVKIEKTGFGKYSFEFTGIHALLPFLVVGGACWLIGAYL